jgi:hypothetical protein
VEQSHRGNMKQEMDNKQELINLTLEMELDKYRIVDALLLKLPGDNGIHEFLEDLRDQVRSQTDKF